MAQTPEESLAEQNDNVALFAIGALDALREYVLERSNEEGQVPIYFRVCWQALEAKQGRGIVLGDAATLPSLVIEFNEGDPWERTFACVSVLDDALDLSEEQIKVLTELASSRSTEITELG